MSRFSTKTKVVNRAGGPAKNLKAKEELATLVLTSFLNDKFYESGQDQLDRLRGLVRAVGPEFAAKTALMARREFNMRSVSHVIAGELAEHAKGVHGISFVLP